MNSVERVKAICKERGIALYRMEKEMENESVTLRYLGKEGQEVKSLSEFIEYIKDAVKLPL